MGFHILNADGDITGYVDTEAEAKGLLALVPEDIFTFFVGGETDITNTFMLQLNGLLGSPTSFFESLGERYGRVPSQINPFKEIQAACFKHAVFFIKIRPDVLDGRRTIQLLSVLQRTLPAGAGVFIIVEHRAITEAVDMSNAGETYSVFYAPDIPNEGYTGADETILVAPLTR
jgi:hypothetical protein